MDFFNSPQGQWHGLVRATRLSEYEIVPPSSQFTEGSAFPNVPVMAEDSTMHETRELLRPSGGVVMFLELGCPPCSLMVLKRQGLIDEGGLPNIPVFGITNESLDRIEWYRESKGLTFPIYCDTGKVFETEHHVVDFPLQVTVGRSGTILSHTYNA